eukprot:gene1096-1033_t
MLIYKFGEHFSAALGIAGVASEMGQVCMHICILAVLGAWRMAGKNCGRSPLMAGVARDAGKNNAGVARQ